MKAVGLAFLLLLAGCGGGSSPSIVGAWRTTAIGGIGGFGAALTSCPGTIRVDGVDVDCSASERMEFTASGTFTFDGIDEVGRLTRETGTYTKTTGGVSITVKFSATDWNGDGVYSASEIDTLATPEAIEGTIDKLDAESLTLGFNYGSFAYAGAFERL